MDSVRFGLALRALRRHRAWTQEQLAERAHLSQAVVSRAERGEAASLTLHTLDALAEALGASTSVRILWHGEALDRLLDAAHAGLVDEVIRILRAQGWEVVAEATFSHYGERGSVDVLAFHPGHRALPIIEVKSVVPDMQTLLSGIDRKARLGPTLAAQRGWRPATVSRLLVLPDDRTARRRLEQHGPPCGSRSRRGPAKCVAGWPTPPGCSPASCSCQPVKGRLLVSGLRHRAGTAPHGPTQPAALEPKGSRRNPVLADER